MITLAVKCKAARKLEKVWQLNLLLSKVDTLSTSFGLQRFAVVSTGLQNISWLVRQQDLETLIALSVRSCHLTSIRVDAITGKLLVNWLVTVYCCHMLFASLPSFIPMCLIVLSQACRVYVQVQGRLCRTAEWQSTSLWKTQITGTSQHSVKQLTLWALGERSMQISVRQYHCYNADAQFADIQCLFAERHVIRTSQACNNWMDGFS